ncbi:MAG TPA: Hsp20/alpha crystallin family protein [Burkholderiaceae bacterium]|nr:Hsp20/alpha crystallin family protein [Burkholderiaceae bacterium]
MLYRAQFPRSVFEELDRLQRDMQQAFGFSPSIRGRIRGGFPAMNIGSTPTSVEIYLFLPGVDPKQIELNVEKGVLVVAGERRTERPTAEAAQSDTKAIVHIDERFSGRFRRVVTLPEDIDPDQIDARYRDGLLHICIQRRKPAEARQITIQ